MMERLEAIGRYLLERAQEASTWRGVVLMATVAGVKISEEAKEVIALAGLGLAGLIGAIFPDKK